MMDGSFFLEDMSALVSTCLVFSAATPPALFFVFLCQFTFAFCFCVEESAVLLLQRRDDGYFGAGSYHGVGFPVQCLCLVLYRVESFLESEKRHGIGVF
ncbi:hypothetical protein J3F84DRAFT_241519 [Trichoderma pleuroticola]